MKLLHSAARILALLALAGTAQAAQPPCTEADFEKFSLYDAAAMNTRIPAQELRRVFSEQFGLEMGALNHLHAHGVLHGDLYAHNILWNPATGDAVLSDFGAAMLTGALPSAQRTQLQAIEWRAFAHLENEIAARTSN